MCLIINLLSKLCRSNVPAALLSSSFGILRDVRRARDVILRAQIEMRRAQNRRKTCPNELSASIFEALEVSGTPRGDQESLKEVRKSPRRASRRCPRTPKSRSTEPVE